MQHYACANECLILCTASVKLCMYACILAYVCVYTYMRMIIHIMYAGMYVTYVCMYVCRPIYLSVCYNLVYVCKPSLYVCIMPICMHVSYAYMYGYTLYMYTYECMYLCML